jgi:ABC-type nitrate/sulfonate/bicarbonate transport system substrate-binding protein
MLNYLTTWNSRLTNLTFIIIFFFTCAGLFSCSGNDAPVKTESITIGTIAWEPSTLLYIAENQGYFEANGLNVTIKDYDTGLAATEAMLNGQIDIAACAEFIVVERLLQHKTISSIATIAETENEYVIGRTDKGIETTSDLRGKTVGLPRQTICEFYFGRFLELHNMSIRDVIMIDISPPLLSDALAGGRVDAVAVWQPYAGLIEKRLADGAVIWPVQGGQMMKWNLTCLDSFINSRNESVNRILKSLVQAEKYVIYNPVESQSIIQNRLNYDGDYLSSVWLKNRFSLSLNQSLVAAMEDEARWMISNNLTAAKAIPDFTDYIYEDALKAVESEAVNIIR